MLSAVFQKHQSSNFISTAQLEAEMKAQMASMQQTVEKMRAPTVAPMTMSESFSAVSPEVRKAERTINFVDNIISEMTNGMIGDGASSLFSLASEICDTFSPEDADILEEISTKGNLNASVDAAVQLRDETTSNPRVQKMAQVAFEKDMQRFAQQQKIQLGSLDSTQGLQNRIKLMEQRLEKVAEAKARGLQYVELDANGINLPEMRNELGWKNASVGYTPMRAKQSMHGGMRLIA